MDISGATDGRHGLEEERALVHEAVEPSAQGQVSGHRDDEHRDPLDEPLGHRRVQRLQVIEVLEDRAHRHLGPFGDPGSSRPQVALVDEADGRVDDGLASAHRPQRAAIGGRDGYVHDRGRLPVGSAQVCGATADPWWATQRQRSPART